MRVKLLILLSFFFLTNLAIGQTKVPFKVVVYDKSTGKKESGVSVKLYEGSSVVKSFTTDASGLVQLILDGKKKYKLEFSKGGKVTRYVNIDLKNVDDELIQGANAPKGELDMSLFDQLPNVDYSYVTSNPATEYFFDPSISQNLEYDTVLAEKMVKKVQKILKDAEGVQKQDEANYNSIIKQADALFVAKKYEEALVQYESAVKIKGKETEKHPNDRLIEIDGILKAAKSANLTNSQLDSEYKGLITAADGLRDQKKYAEAIARYNEALAKKQEQYPKDQIAVCEAAIVAAKKEAENAGKYDAAIKLADGFYGQQSWMAAKDKYKEALKLKPGDPVSTAKLADIDGKLNVQKTEQDQKKKYNDAIAAADAFMGTEKWTEAKAKFTEALTFESASIYAKNKIKEADLKLAEIAKANALKEQIAKLMEEGSTALTSKQLPAAKSKFEQVLALDKEHSEAKSKLAEVDKQIEFEKANAEKIATAKKLVLEGDALDKAAKHADAKAKYQESIALIPDVAVQAKIDAIDLKLKAEANKAESKAKHDKAILDGDAALATTNFEEAKKRYEEAQIHDAGSLIAKQKLLELEKKVAQATAEKDKNQKYQEALNAGITALSSKEYVTAKDKFKAAIAIDGTKPEAKEKLAEVEKMIAENAQSLAQKEKYEQTIKAGSDLLISNKLPEAKKKFEEAAILDPSQTLPKDKIKEIEGLIAKADKEKQVTTLLAEGLAALGKKDLAAAKGKYQQVLGLAPSNSVASEKLLEISKLENDQASEAQKQATFEKLKLDGMAFQNQNKYAEAKQKYLEAKAIKSDDDIEKAIVWCDKKIAEELKDVELNKKYNAILTEAKNLESAKKYDEAIAKYTEALALKNEQEPKNRIEAIKVLKDASAEQLKVEQDYLAAIKKGDDLVAAKKYTDAIQSYNAALVLKPYEKLPVEKAENAKKLSEAEPSDNDAAYQKIIDVGNKAFDEKNFAKAKEMYNRAVNFRPADSYPKQKLAQIEELEKEDKIAQEKQTQFVKKMAEADALAKASKLEDAISAYKAAKTIKPDEVTPDQKIAELQTQIANRVDPALEAKKRYDEAMAKGNSSVLSKDYNGAITNYEEALRYQAKDQTALNKIAEMRQILDDLAKENAANQDLQKMITAADQEFNDGKWSAAKSAYDKILTKYPSNSYAYEQSKKSEMKLREIDSAEKERVYQNILTAADDKFVNTNYTKAKELYERALVQRPADPYPKQKLKEIQNILNPTVAQVPTIEPTSNKLELKDLGQPTDNSLDDGKKLQEAADIRKGRTPRNMIKKLRNTTDRSKELADKQNSGVLSADSTFSEIRIDESKRIAISTEKVQNNVDLMDQKNLALSKNTEENNTIKELNIVNQKQQLEAANESVLQANNRLDGGAIENNEKLKVSTTTLGETDSKLTNEAYTDIINNTVKYTGLKIKIDANNQDDLQERLAEEKKVRDAYVVQVDLANKNADKALADGVETKAVLEKVENNITVKTSDDQKLSQNNDTKIKEIEKVNAENGIKSNNVHIENSQKFAAKNSQTEAIVAESITSRVILHDENINVIETKRDEKTEIDRADYNKAYIKNIENKKTLNNGVIEVEKNNNLPSIAAAENNASFKNIQATSVTVESEKQKTNSNKLVENNATLTKTQLQIQDNSAQNTQATDNDLLLKNSTKELGTTTQIQQDRSSDKTQATKKQIDDIESNQPVKVSTGTYDVDLSKYPEGVNQEKFEQVGPDGLLSGVVTRRVVVKEGKADVYVRTQTIDVITYSKNGAPCTELVWQRETQDAKLKRNY
jgi:epidermal growth factor receptor substrate 15